MFPLRDLCELCDSARKVNPQNISPSSKTTPSSLLLTPSSKTRNLPSSFLENQERDQNLYLAPKQKIPRSPKPISPNPRNLLPTSKPMPVPWNMNVIFESPWTLGSPLVSPE